MPLHMRFPKLRGFKNPFRTEYQVVNLDKLSSLFPEGGDVTRRGPGVQGCRAQRTARQGPRQRRDHRQAVNVTADAFSASAKQKIEAAGGSATTA
jgi:large subunit ribosomal protein L15